MNHTQGRWKVTRAQGMPVIATESNPFIYFVSVADWQETQEYEANAYRIVACVNAFDGIEDPQKMRDTWEAIKHLELDAYDKTKQELDKANNNLNMLRKELEFVTGQLSELKILCYANLQLMEQEDADEFEAEIQAICGSNSDNETDDSEQQSITELGPKFELVNHAESTISLDLQADAIFNLQEQIIGHITSQIDGKLKSLFKESLALKGHVFESDEELLKFVKAFCHAETQVRTGETTYFAFKLPFLKVGKSSIVYDGLKNVHFFNFGGVTFL
jgi:hypothetical protein